MGINASRKLFQLLKYVFIDVDMQARYPAQPVDVRDALALQDMTCYISSLPLDAHRRRDDLHGPFSDGCRLRMAMRRVHVFWSRADTGNGRNTSQGTCCCIGGTAQALSVYRRGTLSRCSLQHGLLFISTASSFSDGCRLRMVFFPMLDIDVRCAVLVF